jgi:hypothetical protein
LEQRVLLTMANYEAYAWYVVNEMRQDPSKFADELEALYRNTGGGHGYAASDPVWTDLRNEINRASHKEHFEQALSLLRTQPRLGPLAWEDRLEQLAQEHNTWMWTHAYAHSWFGGSDPKPTGSPLPGSGATGINGEYDLFDLDRLRYPGATGNWSTGSRAQNIGYSSSTGQADLPETAKRFSVGSDAYRQRQAYADIIGFITEVNSSSLGHLKNLLGRDDVNSGLSLSGAKNKEIGVLNAIGIDYDFRDDSQTKVVATHDFSRHVQYNGSGGYIAGVAYSDRNGNGRYDIGEGVSVGWEIESGGVGSTYDTSADNFGVISEFTGNGRSTITVTAGGRVLGRKVVDIEDNNVWIEIRVSSGFGLVDDTTPVMARDLYESNDAQAQATSLGTVTPADRLSGTQTLSIDRAADQDWFRFDVFSRPARANIRLGFRDADGDIDAALYRLTSGALQEVGSGRSSDDDEVFDLDLRPGTYYLKVYGYNGATNFYSLTADVASSAGTADLVGFYRGSWYVGRSTGATFTTSKAVSWKDTAWAAVLQGDFDGNGSADFLGLVRGEWWVGLAQPSGAVKTSRWAKWADTAWKNATAADLNGDGKADLIARVGGQWWAALSTGSGFAVAKRWAAWADAAWSRFDLTDLTGDGKADLLGFIAGAWYAGVSNGSSFGAASRWAKWANVAWTSFGVGDFDGDGRSDIYGLVNGAWYVGRSTGTAFNTSLREVWANAAWKNVVIADFDGDGRADLAARVGGSWFVSQTNAAGGRGRLSRWAVWANVDWRDVLAADFDGDGRADLLGRFGGAWYVADSTGVNFVTSLWANWAAVDWHGVAGVKTTPRNPG